MANNNNGNGISAISNESNNGNIGSSLNGWRGECQCNGGESVASTYENYK